MIFYEYTDLVGFSGFFSSLEPEVFHPNITLKKRDLHIIY